MNPVLAQYLTTRIGVPLSPGMAEEILLLSLPAPTDGRWRNAPPPVRYRGYTIGAEPVALVAREFEALQQAYWEESGDAGRGAAFDMDVTRFIEREARGQYLLVTVRSPAGEVVGLLGLYLLASTRSDLLIAQEDALYLMPEHRRGHLVSVLLRHAERACWALGADEIRAAATLTVASNHLLRRMGFAHAANHYVKYRHGQ